jgi:hypothetical protein
MNKWVSLIVAGIISAILYLGGEYYLTALGIGLLIFSFLDFVEKVGNTLPILELMLFIACLQWILGPYIDYNSTHQHYKYYMYVKEDVYMDLVVPSLYLFAIPIYFFSNKVNYIIFLDRIKLLRLTDKMAIYLVVAGFTADVLGRFVPDALAFVFFLLSGIKFIGVLFLFYSHSKKKWVVLFTLLFVQLLFSVAAGLFHNLLLWLILMFTFIAIFYKISFARKIVFLIVGFWVTFILQTVKGEYRKIIWQEGFTGNKVQVFLDAFENKSSSFFLEKDNNVYEEDDNDAAAANNRLNQGWIISKIMDYVPSQKPFLDGESIKSAVLSSLFLSSIAEIKAVGGGKATYQNLTGFELTSSTSMGTGILGEAYGNFGVGGTYIFMFIWGCILGLFLLFIFNKSNIYYTLPLWIPIIFLQVVKAETDFYTVLNHLVKSTILIFFILYILRKKFKIAV